MWIIRPIRNGFDITALVVAFSLNACAVGDNVASWGSSLRLAFFGDAGMHLESVWVHYMGGIPLVLAIPTPPIRKRGTVSFSKEVPLP